MKKRINGRTYDTKTARRVGYWNNKRVFTASDYWEETLFRKKTGEYFLYMYCTPYGATIIPESTYSAKVWASKHMDAEDFKHFFGKVD